MYRTNLYREEDATSILSNPTEIDNRILGSKLRIVMEQLTFLTTVFAILGVFSFLARLSMPYAIDKPSLTILSTPQFRPFFFNSLKFGVGLSIMTLVSIKLPLFYQCAPFSDYWMIPATSQDCTTRIVSSVFDMCFSLSFTGCLMHVAYVVATETYALHTHARKRWFVAGYVLCFLLLISTILNKYALFAFSN